MKYYEVRFTLSPFSSDAADLLAALAAEAGFETFEETPTGTTGYVQQTLYSEEALREALHDFPFEGVAITYDIREAEDRDWNEQWEQEGFEPILVEGGRWRVEGDMPRFILIHDGRHLPTEYSPSTLHLPPSTKSPSTIIPVEIDARLAFGTGTHETTRMVCSTLLDLPLQDKRLLDCGCGTGVLSICALKLGASQAVGYDIDEWAADNALHNAVINQVDNRFTSLLGDATLLDTMEGDFDVVVANINRNILLADMPAFRRKMAPGAQLVLSGFLTADIPLLTKKAASLGLRLASQKQEADWGCLLFES